MQTNPRTRMFKVLAALMASMTVGGLVLGWVEPGPIRSQVALSAEQCILQARTAVASRATLARDWRSIEIVALDELPGARGPTLTAVESGARVHFVVADSGAVQADASWRAQTLLGSSPHIRIGLVTHAPGEHLPELQLAALQALVDALNTAVPVHPVNGSLPVRFEDSPVRPSWMRDLSSHLEIRTAHHTSLS